MWPGSSVSGFYYAHPESRYFGVGKIERDQVEDYARRKNWTVEEAERWLAPLLELQSARGERGLVRAQMLSRDARGFGLNTLLCQSGEKSAARRRVCWWAVPWARSWARSRAISCSTAKSDPGVVFTIAIIALAAKMAQADGIATR